MRNGLIYISICLFLFLFFYGCIQPDLKEADSTVQVTTAEDLSKKLDMQVIDSKEIKNEDISLSKNVFKADLEPAKTFNSLNTAFEDISLTLKTNSLYDFEGGLESTDKEYKTGYLLNDITVVSEFKKDVEPIVHLDKITSKEVVKHSVQIKNTANTSEEVVLDLEYEIPNAKTIMWNNEEYILKQNEPLEFTAFEKQIEYSEDLKTTYSIPIAEIEVKLEDGSKTMIDFSDIMFEQHRALITYDGKNALVTLQVIAEVQANSEYIIDPYLSHIPATEVAPANEIPVSESIGIMKILDINNDGENDLCLVSENKIKVFYNYLNKENFEIPDMQFIFEGESTNILSLETYEDGIIVGVFPYGTYFIKLDKSLLIQGDIYINEQSQIPQITAFKKAGLNFYGGYKIEDLYFAVVPNYQQEGALSYISTTSDFQEYIILSSELTGSKTNKPEVTCNEDMDGDGMGDICCFGVPYESKVYCINTENLVFDNQYHKYSDIAFVTFTGGYGLGGGLLIQDSKLIASSQNKIHIITDYQSYSGENNINDVSSTTYEKTGTGYGKDIGLNENNELLVLANSGLHKINSNDIGDISNSPKYDIDNELSKFEIAPNGNYVLLDSSQQIYVGERLPSILLSTMSLPIDLDSCSPSIISTSGFYNLTTDVFITDSNCFEFSGISSAFTLECNGHTIYVDGDNIAAIKINSAGTFYIQNCNFVVDGSNSNALNSNNVGSFYIENCNFSIENGEYSNAIKSSGPTTGSSLLDLNSSNINLTNLNNSNGLNISQITYIDLNNTNLSFDNCFGTSGFGLKNPNSINLQNSNFNSIGTDNEQVAALSIIDGSSAIINDINMNIIGAGITGISLNNTNNVDIDNVNIELSGIALTGIYFYDLLNINIRNTDSKVFSDATIVAFLDESSSNEFVISALINNMGPKYEYDWIYSLLSNNSNIIDIQNNIFEAYCPVPVSGIGGVPTYDWENYKTMCVKLKDSYNLIVKNNTMNSEYCVSLASENTQGQITDNKIYRSSDSISYYPDSSSIRAYPSLSSFVLLNDVLDSDLLIKNNSVRSSLAGVHLADGISRYGTFDFEYNNITNCGAFGLVSNIQGNVFDPIHDFNSNIICNNGLYDIYGYNKTVLTNFDTTTCTNYNFLLEGGTGVCTNLCYDCPEILNFNMTANCTDYIYTGFAGEQEEPGNPTQTIPSIYSNDTICLTSSITNPSPYDVLAEMVCYDIGADPSSLYLNNSDAETYVLLIPMTGLSGILITPETNGDIDISSTYDFNSCDYYQCFVY